MATVIRGSDNFDSSVGKSNVVQTHITATSTQTIASNGDAAITGLTASITPKSTSSRIMIDVRWSGESSDGDHYLSMKITRNGSFIGLAEPDGNRTTTMTMVPTSYHDNNQGSTPTTVSFCYLDSPNTTSTAVYAAVMHNSKTSSAGIYNNRARTDDNSLSQERLTSSITLTEVQS